MCSDVTLSEEMTDEEWLAEIEGFGEARGYFQPLGDRHGAVFADNSLDTLLVYFETIPAARATNPSGLPVPLATAEALGWSHLSIFAKKTTWFRDHRIYRFFDRLVDEGFLEDFERVIFYGAGSGGYAAAAFSVAAPGATVIAVAPQATLDPEMAEWDDRFVAMRRTSFTDRYGYAPDMIEAAARVFVVYDPLVELDAMHAALFRGDNVDRIRFRHAGPGIGREVMAMGALRPLFEKAGQEDLTARDFFRALRLRHNYQPYLRNLLNRLHAEERHWLTALLCRAALDRWNSPRFRHHLELAEQKLGQSGRVLPPQRAKVTGPG
jgi:hypothetical protein